MSYLVEPYGEILLILQSLLTGHPRRALKQFMFRWRLAHPDRPTRLHLGCGQRKLPGFINIDLNDGPAVDYVGNILRLPCPDESVERIESYHVIEHIPLPVVESVVRSWYRLLIPGGVVVAECPDINRAMMEYLDGNQDRIYSIYGRQRFSGDAHFFGYNHDSLIQLFSSVGFANCVCGEGTDYHSKLEPCLRIECRKPTSNKS